MFFWISFICKLNLGVVIVLMLTGQLKSSSFCLDSSVTLNSCYLLRRDPLVAALCLFFLFSSFIVLLIFDKLRCCDWLYVQGPWRTPGMHGCLHDRCRDGGHIVIKLHVLPYVYELVFFLELMDFYLLCLEKNIVCIYLYTTCFCTGGTQQQGCICPTSGGSAVCCWKRGFGDLKVFHARCSCNVLGSCSATLVTQSWSITNGTCDALLLACELSVSALVIQWPASVFFFDSAGLFIDLFFGSFIALVKTAGPHSQGDAPQRSKGQTRDYLRVVYTLNLSCTLTLFIHEPASDPSPGHAP